MTNQEKIKKIRDITQAPFTKINNALLTTNGDVDVAIALLISQNDANAIDIANRNADNNIVYSYVHNNKIGAMIIIGSQTDFVGKNSSFLQLAKDICMHIVSNPIKAEFIDESGIPTECKKTWHNDFFAGIGNKSPQVIEKIIDGKMKKKIEESCLLNQKFIKDDAITIKDLINNVSGIVGEKIELKKFIRLSA